MQAEQQRRKFFQFKYEEVKICSLPAAAARPGAALNCMPKY
jgi:hypothetical protein